MRTPTTNQNAVTKKIMKMLALIAAIDPAKVKLPTDKLRSGDRVVGTLTPDLIRLYGLAINKTDEYVLLREENEKKMTVLETGHLCDYGPGCEKHYAAMTELQEKIKGAAENALALQQIFWRSIQVEFSILNENSFGLRENGQVVVSDPDFDEEFVGDSRTLLAVIVSSALSDRN